MSYNLTATDIAAFRQADRIVVAYNPDDNPSLRSSTVRAIREARKTPKTPFAEEQVHELSGVPVKLYRRPGTDRPSGACAFALIYLFHAQHTPESSIIHTLRAGDEIEFVFMPDHHTNEHMKKAGLHGDVLELRVWRGIGRARKHYTWEVHSEVSPNNPVRMIRGY